MKFTITYSHHVPQEMDASTRRNAFVMVFQVAQDKAIAFISANMDKVLNFGDGFSLNLLELIRQVSRVCQRLCCFLNGE